MSSENWSCAVAQQPCVSKEIPSQLALVLADAQKHTPVHATLPNKGRPCCVLL